MKSPEEVVKMVEGCTTEQLIDLESRCEEQQQKQFSLYRAMVHLAISHELKQRKEGEKNQK